MAETEVRVTAGIPSIENTGEVDFFITAGIPNAWAAAGAVAPTGVLYGPLVGPFGGPI